ncbi:nitronate monooxygenase [Alicyclobacillus contaminans]|uniref:NAD(P)H-dependent flavin oxidoreductase n=1 Tax=Alicyclobacillus contaminans TaxID=392016 RepID=UPI00041DEE08|nr:DUF561 domain-containing protein [Alicyclobacillus contaminans]GMA52230.1 nitronate monooxygenase [Alicyclobacillus contaminans]
MLETVFTKCLGIQYPIIQAGMAGGITTPTLVAAVANAGALGTIGAGYLSSAQLRTAIREVRDRTDKPFAVNLFVPKAVTVSEVDIQQMNEYLEPIRRELGISGTCSADGAVDEQRYVFEEQIQVILDEQVPVFSFTFGIPEPHVMQALQRRGVRILGTATTVEEAVALETAGVDCVVVQGSEAGGHRGTFLSHPSRALIGTLALVPQVVDAVSIPVIAAGGIMDGRGLAACLALGAAGVQMGTAFLSCPESGAHPLYQQRVLTSREDETEVTSAYSGKLARGIRTEFMNRMAQYAGTIPEYPVQNQLTQDIRRAAAQQQNAEFMSMWSGQGLRLAKRRAARDVVRETMDQAVAVLERLAGRSDGSPI